MEHTALRPKPLPGGDPDADRGDTGDRVGPVARGTDPGPRPHSGPGRGRRVVTLLLGLLAGVALVLAGVGLGTVGATVIGMSKVAELERLPAPAERAGQEVQPGPAERAEQTGRAAPVRPAAAPSATAVPTRATLGVEVTDAEKYGALVVAVHVPGPGSAAGLGRGDVLLSCAGAPVDSAAGLVRALDAVRPGERITVTVRRADGDHRQVTITPGVVT